MHRPTFQIYIVAILLFLMVAACGLYSPKNNVVKEVYEKLPDTIQSTVNASEQQLDSLQNIVDSLDISKVDTLDRHLESHLDSLRTSLDSLDRRIQGLNDTSATGLDSMLTGVNGDTSAFKRRPPSAIDIPVFSVARDSSVEDFTGKDDMIYYYGDVKVTYGNMEIKSEFMAYNIDTKTVYASGIEDSTGTWIGKPEMIDNGKSYRMFDVYYNFESRKSKIKDMITEEEDGILHGNNLKMMPDKSINIKGGKYTVCDHDHPHYYLNMTTAKVVTQPKQRTVFGPAYLVVGDVPIYPLMIPFGFVPSNPERKTGILFPKYGEEAARGFFIKDGGFYITVGDFFDIALTMDYYTKGSWAVDFNSRYKLMYKFSGNLGLTYSKDIFGEKDTPDYSESSNFDVNWTHSQDPKARPGTSFSASVNFSSPSNNQFNNNGLDQALESSSSSSISYSRTWSKMNLSMNLLHSQNSRDSSYALTLPNVTLNVNRFYPFKKKTKVGKEQLYEQISLSYNTTFQNKINFQSKDLGEPNFIEKFKAGMTHKFSIGLPQFTLLKYFNFSPSVSYGMNMYFQTQDRYYDPEEGNVETLTSDLFSDFGISQDFSASMSMSTRIYGMYTFKGSSKLMAIRHMVTPSVSFNYKPELAVPINGQVVYNYTDVKGEQQTLEYNKYSGGLYSPPGSGRTAGLSFSLGNNIEAKVRDDKDTSGVGTKKIKILDQLNFSGSYNFLADSMKLSTIAVSSSTTIFEKVTLSGGMTLDPYAISDDAKRINTFNIVKEGGLNLVRLTRANASLSYRLEGKGQTFGNDGGQGSGGGAGGGDVGSSSGTTTSTYNSTFYHPVTGEYIPGGWLYYMNPQVPWSLSLSYSYNFNRNYSYANEKLLVENQHTQTMSGTFAIRLTNALNINLRSGFDFSTFEMTSTEMTATYDLHCFIISVSWIPMGKYESWNFSIAAKAAALADLLKYQKNKSRYDTY